MATLRRANENDADKSEYFGLPPIKIFFFGLETLPKMTQFIFYFYIGGLKKYMVSGVTFPLNVT